MASMSSAASSTVCVQLGVEPFPGLLQDAASEFLRFGDIARIDMTLASTHGRLLVTFFDVRSAQKLVASWLGAAQMFSPSVDDFHAVSIAASLFEEVQSIFLGLVTCIEVAGISRCGENIVMEFHDMRVAQRVAMNVPGCRAWRPQTVVADMDMAASEPHGATSVALAAQFSVSGPLQNLIEYFAGRQVEFGRIAGAARDQGVGTRDFGTAGTRDYRGAPGSDLPAPACWAGRVAAAPALSHPAARPSVAAGNLRPMGQDAATAMSASALHAATGSGTSTGWGMHRPNTPDSEDLIELDLVSDCSTEYLRFAAVDTSEAASAAASTAIPAHPPFSTVLQNLSESLVSLHGELEAVAVATGECQAGTTDFRTVGANRLPESHHHTDSAASTAALTAAAGLPPLVAVLQNLEESVVRLHTHLDSSVPDGGVGLQDFTSVSARGYHSAGDSDLSGPACLTRSFAPRPDPAARASAINPR